ncbi:MAG: transposase [Bdellovibrionaceae bacterium]|nr:transposase [Pseudobdellovibrionaceae bacterium]
MFHQLLDQKCLKKFRRKLGRWYYLVRVAKLPLYRKFALKVMKYRKNIEAYIRSRLTTEISEGLNNKIKVLKRMGYNYTNEKRFQNKIGLVFLRFGDLGTQLQSHFQLFQTRDINAYLNYSHILVHFDAPLTQATGFPRFRIYIINPNTNSADEMLATFRNHNNDHPRLQVVLFQFY